MSLQKQHDLFYYHLAHNDNNFKHKIHSGTEILIHIPFVHCLSNFCVNIFVQPKGFHFNFTVLNMNVSSPETSYCLFQGLNMGEMWEDSYSTIDELCSEFKTYSDASVTSYYTRGSPLYLVLYWYMGYTSINATVLVNVTKCKAVF